MRKSRFTKSRSREFADARRTKAPAMGSGTPTSSSTRSAKGPPGSDQRISALNDWLVGTSTAFRPRVS